MNEKIYYRRGGIKAFSELIEVSWKNFFRSFICESLKVLNFLYRQKHFVGGFIIIIHRNRLPLTIKLNQRIEILVYEKLLFFITTNNNSL